MAQKRSRSDDCVTDDDGFLHSEEGQKQRAEWKARRKIVKKRDYEASNKLLILAFQCLKNNQYAQAEIYFKKCDEIHMKHGWRLMSEIYLGK